MKGKSWDIVIDEEYHYIRFENKEVVFGIIFDGGKTGVATRCTFTQFLEGAHEVNIRVNELFGVETAEEIRQEILKK